MQVSADIDNIVRHLDEFLDAVSAGLLLNGGEQVQLMDRLFADCVVFSRYISQNFTLSVDADAADVRGLSRAARKELQDQRLRQFADSMAARVRENRQSVAALSRQFNDKLAAWRKI